MAKKTLVMVIVAAALFVMAVGDARAYRTIPLPAGPFNQALGRAINDSDMLVGVAFNSPPYVSPLQHPFVPFYWDPATNVSTILDGMASFGQNDLDAWDISNDGAYIVGNTYETLGPSTWAADKPYIWYKTTLFSYLPLDAGYIGGMANFIVESENAIYGKAWKGSGVEFDVKWAWDGSGWDFTDEAVVRPLRSDLNANGSAVDRWGYDGSTGLLHAGIKDPAQVPEPGTLLLLGAGLFTLGFWAYSRRALLARAPRVR